MPSSRLLPVFTLLLTAACLNAQQASPSPLYATNPPPGGVAFFPSASATPSPSPSVTPAKSYGPAPSENRYDILSKMIGPLAGVLLGGQQNPAHALFLKAKVGQVAGRLPQVIQGAEFQGWIEYPGRIRLEVPVLGETITVCRNGNQVWAMPGSKIQFLLDHFQTKPLPSSNGNTPLHLPFTSQQAVLLPALFQLDYGNDVADIDGVSCRVISGGLMPELAKAAKAEDFSSKLWICSDYTPRRIDIRRSDFAMSFLIAQWDYTPSLPASLWQPPAGATDVYHCDETRLEQLLYVVMNSLQRSASGNSSMPSLDQNSPFAPAPSTGIPSFPQ